MSVDTSQIMQDWAPNRQLSLAQARRRTEIVKQLRFSLVAAAIITLGIFLGYIARNAYDRASRDDSGFDTDDIVIMENPRFTGRNATGELYVITADSAERRRSNEDLVDLTNPKLVDANATEVTAPRGLFDRANETLNLYEDVLLVDARGNVFNSTHSQVMTDTGRVIGIEPLEGTGQLGDITADAYEADNEAGILIFTGNVKTFLYEDPEADD